MSRRIVRSSWNTAAATGTIEGHNRLITPFRAVNNLGDFLGRQNYVCGGSNQVNSNKPGWKGHIGAIMSHCDSTNVPANVANNKFVSDSSDYITFKKQRATNLTYDDSSFVGDDSHGSYSAIMRVRR
jgi:hypothetical protein